MARINITTIRELNLKHVISSRGQDLTEYAFLVALIAILVVVAVVFFGDSLSEFWSDLAGEVEGLLS